MSKNVKYWLWLQKALGDDVRFKEFLDEFNGIKAFYESNILEWRMSPNLVKKQIERLEKINLDEVDSTINLCNRNGWQIVDFDDERYPDRLKEIPNPPAVLYIDGEMPDIDSTISIGMVGTRNASEYSIKVAEVFSRGIAEQGAVVVSGGALGIDTSAHLGAVNGGGKTICVLGCGFGTDYLKSNRRLREQIRKNGALITEYPPFTSASKYTFPRRNRIISGLSLGVLVVEASLRSGSLITANCAVEQGRDVFAVPCSVLSQSFSGTNRLLSDGAIIAIKPADLLNPYAERFNIDLSKVKSVEELLKAENFKVVNAVDDREEKLSFENLEEGRRERERREKELWALDKNAQAVYDVLADNFKGISEIIDECNLKSFNVSSALTVLEIKGLAVSAPGKRFKRA